MKKILLTWALLGGMGWSAGAFAQSDYPTLSQATLSQATQRLQKVATNSSAELKSLTKTAGGKDIWVLRVGTGEMDQKPAIAVVGKIMEKLHSGELFFY